MVVEEPSLEGASRLVARLDEAVGRLQAEAAPLAPEPLSELAWYQTLSRKLRPQLDEGRFLILAVVGGTNIGKSAVFNHIAGERASASKPTAAGTKHPVLLVPNGFNADRLPALFPGFKLRPWEDAADPLESSEADRLFWRTSAATPDNLLVLDTPDVDSDAAVNWERADRIRRTADLLVAVLTQQKYNDRAVKEFFRRAADEGKQAAIVFNQVMLPDDEAYWPEWVGTFCEETGLEPRLLYLAPHDRKAADEVRLPFYERAWPADSGGRAAVGGRGRSEVVPEGDETQPPEVGRPTSGGSASDFLQKSDRSDPGRPSDAAQDSDGVASPNTARPTESVGHDEPRNLLEDLSGLHFDQIKFETLRGGIAQVARDVPAWLEGLRKRAGEFSAAAEELGQSKLAEVRDWPQLPAGMMRDEIRSWWGAQREGWSRKVHNFYGAAGELIGMPFKALRSEPEDPWEAYRRREWSDGVLRGVEQVFVRLEFLARAGHERLRPKVKSVLEKTSRVGLLAELERAHADHDFEAELRQLVQREMDAFKADNPQMHGVLKTLDKAAAAARPLVTAGLFAVGAGPLVEVGVAGGVVHIVGDLAGGAATTVVGEKVLAKAGADSMSALQAQFRRLHARHTEQRVGWLSERLGHDLLGDFPELMRTASELPRSEAFGEVERAAIELDRLLSKADM